MNGIYLFIFFFRGGLHPNPHRGITLAPDPQLHHTLPMGMQK